MAAIVGRHLVTDAEREHHSLEYGTHHLVREVLEEALERLANQVEVALHRVLHERQIGYHTALILVMLEGGGGQIEVAQHVTQTGGDHLLALEIATQHQHGDVGAQGQPFTHAGELLVVASGFTGYRRAVELAQSQPLEQGAEEVAGAEGDVLHQQGVKLLETALHVGVGRRFQLGKDVRVAAGGTLPEDHQVTGQDVGPFHRDGHRNAHVGVAGVVFRAQLDGATGVDVHGVIHDLARHFGHVVLGNRGDDGRCLTQVQGTCGHTTCPFQLIGEAADAGQRFLHPFKLADGHAELFTHVGVGAHGAACHVTTGGAKGRQRDAATGGEALHQHAPAATGVIRAADDPVERNEHILAEGRAVQERQTHGVVAIADTHARVAGGDEGAGDAELFLVTQQFFRVIEFERQPQHGGAGRQGDVTLVPVEANTQHLFTLVHPFADDSFVRNGACIGACLRPGQGEAGHFLAVGQPR